MKKKKQLRHPLIESLIQFYECYTVPEQLKKNRLSEPLQPCEKTTNARYNIHKSTT